MPEAPAEAGDGPVEVPFSDALRMGNVDVSNVLEHPARELFVNDEDRQLEGLVVLEAPTVEVRGAVDGKALVGDGELQVVDVEPCPD